MLNSTNLFFILGVTKTFNIFEIGEQNGSNKNEALADTRTFIYVEAITSALTNHYLWQGRTPAHGYDSYFQVGFLKKQVILPKRYSGAYPIRSFYHQHIYLVWSYRCLFILYVILDL